MKAINQFSVFPTLLILIFIFEVSLSSTIETQNFLNEISSKNTHDDGKAAHLFTTSPDSEPHKTQQNIGITKENVAEENSPALVKIIEELKNEVNQLNGRVTRLEIMKPDAEKSENPRIRRSSTSNENLKGKSPPKPCLVKEACAFDYKTDNTINLNDGVLPTSCRDLQKLGHYLKGFYPIKTGNKMSLTLCDFTSATMQEMGTMMGYMDIKTSAVYFHVRRNTIFSEVQKTIPFEIENLNIGNAMDIKSGIFKTPKAGVYYFTYSGIKESHAGDTLLFLRVNRVGIAMAHATGIHGSVTMSLHATVQLKVGDEISLALTAGNVMDGGDYKVSNFVGFLLEENLSI